MLITPEMLIQALKSGDDGMSRYRNADTDITGIDGWFDLNKTVEWLNAELIRQAQAGQTPGMLDINVTAWDPGRPFVGCSEGSMHEIAYRVRLLKDLPLIDGKPGDIANHTGEVLVMNEVGAIKAISEGWGEVLGGKVRTKRS